MDLSNMAVTRCPRCKREFAAEDMEQFTFPPGAVHRGKDGVDYPMAGKKGVVHRPCGYEAVCATATLEYETVPDSPEGAA